MKYFLILLTGVVLGGVMSSFVFADIQPRSYLSITHCKKCYRPSEVLGLLAAIGITKTPGLIPDVVAETDKTIAIRHPFPEARVHYVIFPKQDIQDIGDVTADDQTYITDAMNVTGELIRTEKLENYRLITNGPGYQQVRYLHWHLLAE